MPLHPQIIHHLQRLAISVPSDLDGSAVEILSERVDWHHTQRYSASFDRRRELLVASGIPEAADWSDDELVEHSFEHGPHQSSGLLFGQSVELDFHTGVDNEKSTWWSEDRSHLYFLEENPDDPSDPIVSTVDQESVEEQPYPTGTVSQVLAIVEPVARARRNPLTGELIQP